MYSINMRMIWAWIGALWSGLTRRSRRFVLLTPPFLKRQLLYDKHTKNAVPLVSRTRDDVDMYSYMFNQLPYRFRKLKREPDINGAYHDICERGQIPLIIDCGANIGSSAVYFALTYPEAKLVAVEPEQDNCAVLRQNTERFAKVHVVQAGISSTDGFADTVDTGLGHDAFRTRISTSGATPLIAMRQLVEGAASRGEVPFIVKIDIEGFEANLFEANTEWVDKFAVVFVELHDWMLPGQAPSMNVLKVLSSLDRDFILKGENIISISNRLHACAEMGTRKDALAV